MRKGCIVVFLMCLLMVVMTKQATVHDLSQYESETMQVEVKGEVLFPGVYEIAWHATMQDALEKAGGISDNGDVTSLNLSDALTNHAVIVVPKQKEQTCISINSATLEELDTLKGIGPVVASRILIYRETTPFKRLEDIKNVKGIGDKMYEKIKDQLCL